MDPISQIHDQVSEPMLQAMVAAFYRRVKDDDVIGPMYPLEDLAGAEQRLADFLIYRFGGSQRYLEQRGHPRLRMRHFAFSIDATARDRWLQLMAAAMDEVAIPATVAETMRDFFTSVAGSMQNRT
jgi:hemoglobin